MIVVLIRLRLRSDVDVEALARCDSRMTEIVSRMPGYLGSTVWTDTTGEDQVSMIRFSDEASPAAWRNDADHVLAQIRGGLTSTIGTRSRYCSASAITSSTVAWTASTADARRRTRPGSAAQRSVPDSCTHSAA
ncbi:antibiotic biosynthesis monooxygenase family protein [Tsukamurella soli]|uniref:antibiotic biosynthesis monooxygenase family protein n=1 Tax=Tsukamurella soli TaxID=644556 RepID=UPI0031EC80A2